mgnify:FL=1
MTVIRKYLDIDPRNYDIHLNFPGGIPVDGPSAGIAILTAVYSSITGKAVDNKIAMTGEVSVRGDVKPIGGVPSKIEAAVQAGAERVLVPIENWQESFDKYKVKVIPVKRVEEVIRLSLYPSEEKSSPTSMMPGSELLTASGSRKKGFDCTY